MGGVTTLLSTHGHGREAPDDVDLVRDRVLVEQAQAGDCTAFDDLYQRYYQRLYRFCLRRLRDTHEAEDVAQEAFARAWRALPNFAGARRFYPWLSVIASHLCTDVQRRRRRSTPVAELHQQNVASTEDGGEELVLAAVESEMVARAFGQLSDRHQRILSLREGSGWSYQRIADHEGVGITAVETLLWRARQALKREFATITGNDGKAAGVVGGLLSLATLHRFLRLPATAARRLAHIGTWAPATTAAATAATTAAAAAVVVAAVVGGGGVAPRQATLAGNTPLTQVPAPVLSPPTTPAAPPDASAKPPAAATGALRGGTIFIGGPPPGLRPLPNGPGGAVALVGSAIGTVGGVLGTITGGLATAVGGIAGALPGNVGSALQQTTAPLAQTLGQLPQQLTNTLTRSNSASAGNLGDAAANVGCTVQGLVGTVSGLLRTTNTSPPTTACP